MLPRSEPGAGAAHTLPGLHDRARRLHRHRQHRGRGHRGGLAAGRAPSSGSGATASSPPRSSSRRPCSASSTAPSTGEHLSAGPMHYLRDGLKAPWLGWIYALVAGHRRPHHHALHAAQLHGGRPAEPVRHPHLGLGHRDRRPGLAGHHRRDQVHRPGGGEALAAEGRACTSSAGCSSSCTHAGSCPRCSPSSSARRSRPQAAAGGTAGVGDDDRDALRPGPRHLRQRGGLRHGGRGLRHGPQRASPCSRA